ncbi:MAG: nuclear transport factor 2 family protein [Bacteroidales bacterium]|nr:nuclear transport factor 2 family protein [Lentimicrobiaceae bacterium]MDD5694822.1 nuclear transport factor 2 family protein [Bacteroidales bacterium]
MKKPILLLFFTSLVLFYSCSQRTATHSAADARQEIRQTEHAFNATAHQEGVAEAFYRFADSSAVINRGNDSLISGREKIKKYYDREGYRNAVVNWEPDFIEVSRDGDLGYSYGKYVWQIRDTAGQAHEYRGIYMTIWKRQKDGTWKYVWD